jgi:large subunit ribosomal protein L29
MRAKEVREYTNEELSERIAELKEERFKLRFQRGLMDVENPMLIGTLRKDIARMKTILSERERTAAVGATSGSNSEEA